MIEHGWHGCCGFSRIRNLTLKSTEDTDWKNLPNVSSTYFEYLSINSFKVDAGLFGMMWETFQNIQMSCGSRKFSGEVFSLCLRVFV